MTIPFLIVTARAIFLGLEFAARPQAANFFFRPPSSPFYTAYFIIFSTSTLKFYNPFSISLLHTQNNVRLSIPEVAFGDLMFVQLRGYARIR